MLADRYEIKGELGKGGMGVVYHGYDTRLNRAVAIKFIVNAEIGTEGRARLMAEARAAAQLKHPNIVTIYDVDVESTFIVMELVEGKTLRETPISSFNTAIEITKQICVALDHAHSKGVIHRDLKPENIFVLSDNSIKLVDFGLARITNTPRISQTGNFFGTPAYSAPELFLGQASSPQSDIYALGVTLFEMLTGKLPYSDDIMQVLDLQAPAPSPNNIRPDIPNLLSSLVVQMLNKRPEGRPLSASVVESTLISIQFQQNLSTVHPGLNLESLKELANKRKIVQMHWEREWRRKGYLKSSLPALEPIAKDLVLSNQEKELRRGIEHFQDHRLLLITGMPGIGKSTLARTLLELIPGNSPPPFWYDFYRQQTSGNTLGILLDRIASYLENCLGTGVYEEVMSFRNTAESRASAHDVDVLIDYLNQDMPIWLVFDNLETVLARGANGFTDPDLELLFDGLKSNTHNAKIIITNPFIPKLHDGQYLLEFGTQPLSLRGLDEKSSVEYLRANGLNELPEETLMTLAHNASGHPFTLHHIARHVQALGAATTLEFFQGGLAEITEHFKTSLEQRLSEQEFDALQSLAILNREISLDGLCQVAQTDSIIIKRLHEEGLLLTNDTGKFWLHNIVRTSLRAKGKNEEKQAHQRAVSFYRSQKTPTNRQSIDAYANVLEWHHHASEAGNAISSYEALFKSGLEQQLTKWNEYQLLSELCEKTETINNQLPDSLSKENWIQLYQTIGVAHYRLEDFSKSTSYLQSALDLLDEKVNAGTQIELLIYLAYSYNKKGELAHAMDLCQQALTLLSEKKEDILLAKALHLRGLLHRRHGELEKAILDLEEALRLYKSLDEDRGVGNTTGDLGIIYYYKKEYTKAVEYYKEAIKSSEAQQNTLGVIIGHFNIGEFMLYDQQYELAAYEFEMALNMARKKRMLALELEIGFNLVDALIWLMQVERAEEELKSLQSAMLKQPSPCSKGLEFICRAHICWKQNRYEEAMDYFTQGLGIIESVKCEGDQSARAYLVYAEFLQKRGQQSEAKAALKKGKEIFIELQYDLSLKLIADSIRSIDN